ncbi:hypothetical protein H6P81_015417 [Aristolochia fimbriata]|uniref:Uncharacterized protein n=1 Tax=Aristolochia fimbriata TaxID=158543 RepID=A0AAV7E8L3_ARIFI|nr:hypothetical protein H6P81_015417 [Aristolochia fimbriata]
MPPKKKQRSKESTTPSTSTRGNTGDTSTRLSRISPVVGSDDETQEPQFEELPIVESSRPKRGRGPTTGKSLIPP